MRYVVLVLGESKLLYHGAGLRACLVRAPVLAISYIVLYGELAPNQCNFSLTLEKTGEKIIISAESDHL